MPFNQMKAFIKAQMKKRVLPCTVFCWDPLILASYDRDFIWRKDWFLEEFAKSRSKVVHVFLPLGWEHETARVSEPFAASIHEILEACPRLKITVLTNTPAEVEVLSKLGLHAVFCHQNAFLDESKYPLLHVSKRFDAIYVARITPFKRHALAEKVQSLRLIGEYSPKEQDYAIDILRNKLPRAVWSPPISSSKIPGEIASARCGLCLSAKEGAMFVSAEYLLSGIPVVNTASCLGGRDLIFPEFAVRNVPDDPDAVAAAVAEFAKSAPPPEEIRAAVLAKMQPHRETLRMLINDAMRPDVFRRKTFPHKLLLRCTKNPLNLLRYGMFRHHT